MRFGIVYSGERLEPRSFRSLQHVCIIEGLEITRFIDASASAEDRERVQRVAKFLRLAPDRPLQIDFKSVDALIVEVGPTARLPFQLGNLISEAVDAGIHLHLPYDSLTALPFEDVVDLFKRAESNNCVILSCSRFLFGQCYTRFREIICAFSFGGFRDAIFRIGVGPVVRQHEQLLAFGIHNLNVLFDIMKEKPVAISAVNSADPLAQPCLNFTLRFAGGEIANFFLTANRIWGSSSYHWIEMSGRHAYAATDFLTYRYRTGIDTATHISETNDDDQGPVVFGSAGKLRYFTSAVIGSASDGASVEEVLSFSQITKRSLWVYQILLDMLSNNNDIDQRTFSDDDMTDGWPL